MRFSLLPKENSFYFLLEKLALKVSEGVREFKMMIDSWEHSNEKIKEIKILEHDADHIVHEIMVKLNKTFVTPIDREDIYQLTKKLDDVIDVVDALSSRIILFRISKIEEDLKELTSILEEAVNILVLLIRKIQNLKDSNEIFNLCIQVNTLENQGDRSFEKAMGRLFDNAYNPIDVIKWKEIYDSIEEAIDKCEDIADVIWGIVVKYG